LEKRKLLPAKKISSNHSRRSWGGSGGKETIISQKQQIQSEKWRTVVKSIIWTTEEITQACERKPDWGKKGLLLVGKQSLLSKAYKFTRPPQVSSNWKAPQRKRKKEKK